jgi:hypothetical protein
MQARLGGAALVLAFAASARSASGQEKPPDADESAWLDVGLSIGIADRVGEAPNLEITDRAGVSYGMAAFVLPMRWLAAGVAFEHTDLGRERGDFAASGTIDVERDLNALWATLRVSPIRFDDVALLLELGPGLVWQSADAGGIASIGPFGQTAYPFTCEASDSANLGLRLGAGVDVKIGGNVHVVGLLGFDNDRLSSEPLDQCAPGAGTVSVIAFRVAISYRWRLTNLNR